MIKIMVFAASSSSKSINKKLATYASTLIKNSNINIIDLNDYEMPLFSEDKEAELGHHELAHKFLAKISANDALIISLAEHNGSCTTAYKNIFDWCSRINPKIYQNKPMILLATSPGPGGAQNILKNTISSMPFFEGVVKGSFSLPSFYENFDLENNKISNSDYDTKLKKIMLELNN